MTLPQQLITIALCILGTQLTRFLPFLIFSEHRKTPPFVQYLGRVLPGAIFAMLVIYCLKDVPGSGTGGIPEIIAILFIILLHRWRKNTLLSIAGGTVLYMVLVQTIFA